MIKNAFQETRGSATLNFSLRRDEKLLESIVGTHQKAQQQRETVVGGKRQALAKFGVGVQGDRGCKLSVALLHAVFVLFCFVSFRFHLLFVPHFLPRDEAIQRANIVLVGLLRAHY